MITKKIATIIMTTLLVTSSFSGCKKSEKKTVVDTKSPSDISFPLKEKITLTNWVPFSSTLIKSLNENKVYQELEKKTNIHIEFIHPALGQETESFNIMMASNDLPDIIQGPPVAYPGGSDKAISDNVYVKLNDYIDKYAPNYKKLRDSNPEIARQTQTDAKNIYAFNCIQLGDEPAWAGTIVRKDWLEELGLEAPKTIDEFHNMLVQFKEKKGVEVPFSFNFSWLLGTSASFLSAFNVTNDFYNENGTVKYGPIEEGYKSFLTTMNQWYKDGLIDKDFATRDDKGRDALFTSGKAGSMMQLYGAFGGYNTAGKKVDPKFSILAVANLPVKEGDKLHFRQTNFNNKGADSIITTSNKHIPETVKWLDYGYSDEGFLLYNYGVEKTSWDWKEGSVPAIDKPFYPETLREQNKFPQFNNFMLNNPDGTAFWDLVAQYKVHQQAYLRDPMANEGMGGDVKQSMEEWSKPGNDWIMPLISHTDVESQEISAAMGDINTYITEMNFKFIMGVEPLSKFDEYASKIKEMGIDKVIKNKQAALVRYGKR